MSADALHHWFQSHKRRLPWREQLSPYRVWVSEIMLQQTRAQVVIPYFQRWMARWPDVQSLSTASEEDVFKMWEGLGYYRRAKQLLAGAKIMVKHFQGQVPKNLQDLQKIPGIGPYTLGAIGSFAFGHRLSAIDGNAARVLARYFGIGESIDSITTKKKLSQLWLEFTQDLPIASANEALIELGAVICKKNKPSCMHCPLKDSCLARKQNLTSILPRKKALPKTVPLWRPTLLLQRGTKLLIRQNQHKGVMSGLWEWPYLEHDEPTENHDCFVEKFEDFLDSPLELIQSLPKVSHSFTRYKATLFPIYCKILNQTKIETIVLNEKEYSREKKYSWVESEQIHTLTFCSGHRELVSIAQHMARKNARGHDE